MSVCLVNVEWKIRNSKDSKLFIIHALNSLEFIFWEEHTSNHNNINPKNRLTLTTIGLIFFCTIYASRSSTLSLSNSSLICLPKKFPSPPRPIELWAHIFLFAQKCSTTPGWVNNCWIFLVPLSWSRMFGEIIAVDRSMSKRSFQNIFIHIMFR